MNSYVSDH